MTLNYSSFIHSHFTCNTHSFAFHVQHSFLRLSGTKKPVCENIIRQSQNFINCFIPENGGCHADSKSRLQEFIQKDQGRPEYRLVDESGPDHNKTFTVEVYLDSNCIGRGVGHSKKIAEQAAARNALILFGVDG